MRKRNAMGARIRELREGRGLSLKDVAAATGISPSYMSRVERGLTRPTFMMASRIADALGVRPSDLATFQRDQAAVDDALVAALTDAGMDPTLAREILRRISTPARRALLDAIGTAR